MKDTLLTVTIVFIVSVTLLTTVSSTGKFYVALSNYTNPGHLDYNGACCDGTTGSGGTCLLFCNLIFEITVSGLDNSTSTRRLSNKPVSDKSSISFPSDYEGINPVSFNFTRWPDEVNITVTVFDKDKSNGNINMVDQLHTRFSHQGSEYFYILKYLTGQRPKNASSLTILFRYMCDKTITPSCFTDCMNHMADEICPSTPTSGTDTIITRQFIDPYCNLPENNSSSHNCSTKNTTADVTTQPTIHLNTSTKRVFLDSGTAFSNQTTTSNGNVLNTSETTKLELDSSSYTVKDSSSSTESTKLAETTKPILQSTKSTKTQSIFLQEIITTQSSPAQVISRTHSTDPTLGTPPTDQFVYVDKGMTYWPAIVGGVLGGLALLAAAGFLVYYKRQKKLQKRQEIYNVNPKILRKFEEYAENGTSGRAEIPLETEQV